MNLVSQGKQRDNLVLLSLQNYGVMTAPQIQTLHFTNFKTPSLAKRKTEERLKRLSERGKLYRWKVKGENGYRYSLEEKSGRAEHLLLLNWVRIWFVKQLKSWERLHCFVYEPDYKFIRPDAFVAIKNMITGQFRFYYVEMDRTHSNKWDKVPKYNKLFEQINAGKFEQWWVELTEKFPEVLCVTTTEERKEKILQHVREENERELRFTVKLLDELKASVYKNQ